MDDNEIIELDNNTEDTLFDEEIDTVETEEEIIVSKHDNKEDKKQEKKPKKEKKPCFYKRLSKKGKIIFFSCIGFVVLLIVAVCLYFFVFNKKDTQIENIILKANNYIYENGKLKLLNSKGKTIGTYECIDKDTKKCYVANLSNEDNFDTEVYLNPKGEKISSNSKIYNSRFAFIYDDGKIGLYDITSKKIKGNYKLVKTGNNSKDYVVLKDEDNKYGIMNMLVNKTKKLVEFNYDYLGIYNSDDIFVAGENETRFLIDSNGEKLSVNYDGEIRSFSDKYVIVFKDDTYKIYDYDGNILSTSIEEPIDYIRINDGIFEVIINKKLYIYTEKMVCLNPEGIKLKNTYYNKTYMFDKDNELKQTYEAYTIKISEGDLLVTLSDKSEVNINTYENALNANFAYVSYLDGTLLFYEDAEKTTLLGKYSCNNKNKIDKDSTSFDNCFIAKDEVIVNSDSSGYIPIINDNYVFINDTMEGSTTNNIILYNISSKKSEVKYQKVDTGIGNNEIGKVSVQNNIIFAMNTKGSYLAITFSFNGPEKIIDSSDSNGNTSNIKMFGNYVVATRGNTKVLYEQNGKLLGSTNLDEIVDYKNGLLIAKDTKGKISISNEDGKVVASGLSKYEITNDYVIGIQDGYVIINKPNGDKYCNKIKGPEYSVNGNILTVNNKKYDLNDTCKEFSDENTPDESNSSEV